MQAAGFLSVGFSWGFGGRERFVCGQVRAVCWHFDRKVVHTAV